MWPQAEQPGGQGADLAVAVSNQQHEQADQVPIYMQHTTTILVILHVSVFITGLVGNSLVCLSVYHNKSLQTVTNYYIVNLAVADFLVILICLPPTVYWDLTLTWNFGLVLCKLVLYLQTISVSVSVLTLTCISIDRWYAICRPLEFSSTKGRAKITIALIWLISMAFASPDAIYLSTRPLYEENEYVYMDCTYSWPESSTRMYQLCIVSLLFVGPFVLMSISYWHIVNVLWRNETMAESMQQSLCNQLDEEPQSTGRSTCRRPRELSFSSPKRPAATTDSTTLVDMQVNHCGRVKVAIDEQQTSRLRLNHCINHASSGAKLQTSLSGGRRCVKGGGEQSDNRHQWAPGCQEPSMRAAAHPATMMSDDNRASSDFCQAVKQSSAVIEQPASRRPSKESGLATDGRLETGTGQQEDAPDGREGEGGGGDLIFGGPNETLVAPGGSHVSPSRPSTWTNLVGRLQLAARGHSAKPLNEASRADELERSSKKYRKNLANYAASRLGSPRRRAATVKQANCSCGATSLKTLAGQVDPQHGPHQQEPQLPRAGSTSQLDSNQASATGQSNSARFCRLIESRKKAAKMLIVIVIMFGLCYLPIHFLNTLRYTIGLPQNNITTIASLVSHWLCYFNSAVNPLIYNLMSGKFRHEFANLFFCKCFRRSA